MKQFYRIFAAVLTALLLMLPAGAYAADANVEYTGNTGRLIFERDGKRSPDNLFAAFTKVMPGATVTQEITVKNNANNKVKIMLYLRSLGADEAANDFLNQLQLTVTKDTDTPLFDARANETAGLSDWTMIGLLYSGGEADLTLTLKVPTSLGNEYQKQTGKITWQFMAVELPVEEELWVCPHCRECRYHINEHGGSDGKSCEYVCEECGHRSVMQCDECGGEMHKVVYRSSDGREWYYYACRTGHSHPHSDPIPSAKTGDNFRMGLWAAALAGSMTAVGLLLYRRRRQEAEAEV